MSRGKIAIVGAGIVGLSIALRLQQAGYRVTIYDQQEPMRGCSFGNAGYISQANIFPPATPDLLLRLPGMMMSAEGPLVVRASYLYKMLPWAWRAVRTLSPAHREHVIHSLVSILLPARDYIEKLAASADASALLHREGALIAFGTMKALSEKLESLPAMRDHGISVTQVSATELRELEPSLSTARIVGGIYYPNAGRCSNPGGLGERYAQRLLQDGARFIRARVKGVFPGSSGDAYIDTDAGAETFEKVVLSAGIESARLAAPLGYPVPLASERGYHLMLPTPQVRLQRPVLFAEPYFVATPMDEGLRLAGTAEFASPTAAPDMARAHMLYRIAANYIPDIVDTDARPWMGVRPTLPDGMPAIGAVHQGRIIYAFGHGHNGLTLSGITAECVLALASGTDAPVDLTPYSLARFDRASSRRALQ